MEFNNPNSPFFRATTSNGELNSGPPANLKADLNPKPEPKSPAEPIPPVKKQPTPAPHNNNTNPSEQTVGKDGQPTPTTEGNSGGAIIAQSDSGPGFLESGALITGGIIILGIASILFVGNTLLGSGNNPGLLERGADSTKRKIIKSEKAIKEIRKESPVTKEEAKGAAEGVAALAI